MEYCIVFFENDLFRESWIEYQETHSSKIGDICQKHIVFTLLSLTYLNCIAFMVFQVFIVETFLIAQKHFLFVYILN